MAPTTARILEIDVLRGFSLLGIYWINAVVFAFPQGAYSVPTMFGIADEANTLHWIFSELFVEGTMRGLFSLLFGASALIFLNEGRMAAGGPDLVGRYYRRNVILMGFGLVHAYLLLSAYEVLFAYGILGLLLFPLRLFRARWLLAGGLAVLVVGDLISGGWLARLASPPADKTEISAPLKLTHPSRPATENGMVGAAKRALESARNEMEEDVDHARRGYGALLPMNAGVAIEQQTTELVRHHLFDMGGMMLLGMALFKLGVLTGARSARFYVVLMVLGYAGSVLLRGHDVYIGVTRGFGVALALGGAVDYDLDRLPGVLGHIGLIGLLCRSQALAAVAQGLAVVGRLALTNYVLQTVISIFLFYGFGFGLFAEIERYQLLWVCLGVWAAQILLSALWLASFRHGPVEWLWRSLTAGRWEPLVLPQPLPRNEKRPGSGEPRR